MQARTFREKALRWLIVAFLLLLTAGVAFWAGRVTLQPPQATEQVPPETAEIEVVEQELGRVITLTTVVTRPHTPLATNSLTGVVTAVAESGEHGQGDLLYAVGQTPVVLAEGDTPFWRELSEGARGADVRQVQEMLIAAGADLQADGVWGASTTRAARAWQEQQGHAVTGTFPQGSLVAAAALPVHVAIDREVAWLGAVLAGGEEVVSVADGEPAFSMEVTQTQAEMLPTGTEVTVHGGSSDGWSGVVDDQTVNDQGLVLLHLVAPDGGLVCGSQCAELPVEGSTTLLTDVALVPPVTGPVVPVAALTTAPDGTVSVDVVDAGVVHPRQVEVLTVADGLAAVSGVDAGERVRVFGQDSDSAPPAQDELPGGGAPGEVTETATPTGVGE